MIKYKKSPSTKGEKWELFLTPQTDWIKFINYAILLDLKEEFEECYLYDKKDGLNFLLTTNYLRDDRGYAPQYWFKEGLKKHIDAFNKLQNENHSSE